MFRQICTCTVAVVVHGTSLMQVAIGNDGSILSIEQNQRATVGYHLSGTQMHLKIKSKDGSDQSVKLHEEAVSAGLIYTVGSADVSTRRLTGRLFKAPGQNAFAYMSSSGSVKGAVNFGHDVVQFTVHEDQTQMSFLSDSARTRTKKPKKRAKPSQSRAEKKAMKKIKNTIKKNGGILKELWKTAKEPDDIKKRFAEGEIPYLDALTGDVVWQAVDHSCEEAGCADGLPDLLQVQDAWAGTKFGPGCFTGDSTQKTMKIGMVADWRVSQSSDNWNPKQFERGKPNLTYTDWADIAVTQVESANVIYKNQTNIKLEVGWFMEFASGKADSRTSNTATQSLENTTCVPSFITQCSDGMSARLDLLKAWIKDDFGCILGTTTPQQSEVAAIHLMSGCNPKANAGTVGLGWIGTLCSSQGAHSAVNHFNAGWTTFAHELGHNFGAQHSFNEGQGATGGIMDYGDGKEDGVYQFNSAYRKTEVCENLQTATTNCGSTAFTAGTGSAISHQCSTQCVIPCVDSTNTGVYSGGSMVTCQFIKDEGYCSSSYGSKCPVTCERDCPTNQWSQAAGDTASGGASGGSTPDEGDDDGEAEDDSQAGAGAGSDEGGDDACTDADTSTCESWASQTSAQWCSLYCPNGRVTYDGVTLRMDEFCCASCAC